jgi:hypothetical protein
MSLAKWVPAHFSPNAFVRVSHKPRTLFITSLSVVGRLWRISAWGYLVIVLM